MSDRQTARVPSTGTNIHHENSDLRDPVRDFRGMPPGSGLLNPLYWMIGAAFWAGVCVIGAALVWV